MVLSCQATVEARQTPLRGSAASEALQGKRRAFDGTLSIMDKFDRIFQLHAVLASRRTPIPLEDLMARLECSKATLYRAINVLKDTLHAPVEFDTDVGGFRYTVAKGVNAFELPGLWFTPPELQALAVMQRLLKDVGGGLLTEHLGPLSRRLDELTRHRRLNLSEAASRLRFPAIASRPAGPAFQMVASATLQRKKVWIEYHARGTDERSERTVSAQRVTHYRESWYLDAWDEGKDALRCFAIDRILRATILDRKAMDVSDGELDAHYASSYGIFGGRADKLAVLRFTRERARWVAEEVWHPEQQGKWLADGSYELRIPYNNSRELVMDILRYGPDIIVSEPDSLVDEVKSQLAAAFGRYGAGRTA
jgi:proteasome accessory factor C